MPLTTEQLDKDDNEQLEAVTRGTVGSIAESHWPHRQKPVDEGTK